jgi:hypothetical protein
MNDILRFLLGIGVIIAMIAAYALVTNIRRKTIQANQAESCDTTPQGGCCGHQDACSFEQKVQKFDGTK